MQYFGSLRAAAELAEEQIPLAGAVSVLTLLRQCADTHGDGFRGELFTESGCLRGDVTVAVNGAIVQHAAVDEIILRPDDTVALFPVFPGGG